MNTSRKQSIQKTLNIQIGIVVLSVGIIIGVLFLLFSFYLEKNEFDNNINLQTRHLSDTFTQQLWLFDLNTTQQLSDLAVDSSGIIGLRLLDRNKSILVESGIFSNDSAVSISKELRYEGKTLVGYIEILFVNTTWKKHQSLIVIAGICMMVLIITASFLLISSLLKRHLVGPLNDLQKDMIALTTGKFKKSELTGQKAEIQNIIDVFNQMGADLSRREDSQKKVEHQLTKEKIFIEALIHTLPGLFFVYEEGKQLVRWNKNFETVSGFTGEEILMKNPEEWVDKKDQPLIITSVQKILKQGSASVETKLLFKNGPIPYFLTATKFNIEGKKFLLGLGIDITKRKELEKALRQSHKMESIGTLAGGIAHDFNNILFPLLGYAEMLQEDLPADSPLRQSADEIYRASLRAKDLVQQILTLSRQSDQELKPLRVQLILKEALKLLGSSIPKTIDIQTDIDPHCDLVIADPTQIHQIIMNLSTNAYHAMQDTGGQLKIVLSQVEIQQETQSFLKLKSGSYVLLKMIDTGTGIDKGTVDKIFDPYFTTKKMGKGTGLGLSIVQGIVKSCNGDITIYSEPEKGTEVHVYLPAIEKSNVGLSKKPDKIIQTGTERILLVDDEDAIIKMEQQLLARLGYDVTAENGSKKALETFKEHPDQFDLIITDMTMPDMTGIQLAKEIRAIKPDIPIIICTGFSDQINMASSKAFGIQAYLTKPVVKSEIAQTIRNVMDKENIQK